jgi:hypothetical protein
MAASLGILFQKNLLALLRGKPGLVDRDLVLARIGNAKIRRLAIEPICGDHVGRGADAAELAPAEDFDGAGILGGGARFEDAHIGRGGGTFAHAGDRLIERWDGGSGIGRRRLRRLIDIILGASRIRRGDAAISPVEVVELRARRGRTDEQQHNSNHQNAADHGLHYSRRCLAWLATTGLLLGLGACESVENWVHNTAQEVPPGFLGSLIDRPAPGVTVTAGDPARAQLNGPAAIVLPEAAVNNVVGEALRNWLTYEERRNLAVASEQAAVDPTGTTQPWQSADGAGVVTAIGSATSVADVYRSLRGRICRDVWQTVKKQDDARAQLVTLCRDTQDAGPILWVIAKAD